MIWYIYIYIYNNDDNYDDTNNDNDNNNDNNNDIYIYIYIQSENNRYIRSILKSRIRFVGRLLGGFFVWVLYPWPVKTVLSESLLTRQSSTGWCSGTFG